MKPKKIEVLRASSVKRSAMFIHRNQYTAFQYTRVVRKLVDEVIYGKMTVYFVGGLMSY